MNKKVLIVLHGLIATGKTSITKAIAEKLNCHPIHSDEIWFEKGIEDRDDDPSINLRHNEAMLELCKSVIKKNNKVVLDSTARSLVYRNAIIKTFSPLEVLIIFLRCHCPEPSALARISKRPIVRKHDFGNKFEYQHDFGNESEYEKVKKEFKAISEKESCEINLIDVDTENLACSIVNCKISYAKKYMVDICDVITQSYFNKYSKPCDT